MERADPLFLLMGLPTIPVVLVLGKMIRWEDYVVRLWQRYQRNTSPGAYTSNNCGSFSLCPPDSKTSQIVSNILITSSRCWFVSRLPVFPQEPIVTWPVCLLMGSVQEITSLCPGLCVEPSSFLQLPIWWEGCSFSEFPLISSAQYWWIYLNSFSESWPKWCTYNYKLVHLCVVYLNWFLVILFINLSSSSDCLLFTYTLWSKLYFTKNLCTLHILYVR